MMFITLKWLQQFAERKSPDYVVDRLHGKIEIANNRTGITGIYSTLIEAYNDLKDGNI